MRAAPNQINFGSQTVFTFRSGSLDTLMSDRFKIRSDSKSSSMFKDFVHDKNFDFLSYKHELRRAQLMDW